MKLHIKVHDKHPGSFRDFNHAFENFQVTETVSTY